MHRGCGERRVVSLAMLPHRVEHGGDLARERDDRDALAALEVTESSPVPTFVLKISLPKLFT